ncbi:hypothetical protein P5V15_002329 [Pogonomyrmex californicus]
MAIQRAAPLFFSFPLSLFLFSRRRHVFAISYPSGDNLLLPFRDYLRKHRYTERSQREITSSHSRDTNNNPAHTEHKLIFTSLPLLLNFFSFYRNGYPNVAE